MLFPTPLPAKIPDTLLLFPDRIQTVDRFHPEVQRIGDRRTIQWIDICIIYIIMSAGLKRAKRIDRLPRCVDNSSPEELRLPESFSLCLVFHKSPDGNTTDIVIRHQLDLVVFEPDHFPPGSVCASLFVVDRGDISDTCPASGRFHTHPYYILNFTDITDRLCILDQFREFLKHRCQLRLSSLHYSKISLIFSNCVPTLASITRPVAPQCRFLFPIIHRDDLQIIGQMGQRFQKFCIHFHIHIRIAFRNVDLRPLSLFSAFLWLLASSL